MRKRYTWTLFVGLASSIVPWGVFSVVFSLMVIAAFTAHEQELAYRLRYDLDDIGHVTGQVLVAGDGYYSVTHNAPVYGIGRQDLWRIAPIIADPVSNW